MTLIVIRVRGSADFIQGYLLTFDDVAVIETEKRIHEAPTIKVHVVPAPGRKEEVAEKIIDGKLFNFRPRAIAIEAPVKITQKMKNYLKEGGIIIVFEYAPENSIEIETE